MKKRAQIEEDYAKALLKIAQKKDYTPSFG
jgi:F0F1-type ATP synthase delta subunit